jgi:predicted flap endonuclease-1-like 5' DNA nuclease
MFGEIWLWLALALLLGAGPIGWWIWSERRKAPALASSDDKALLAARKAADDAIAGRMRAETELAQANARVNPLATENANLKAEISRLEDALRELKPTPVAQGFVAATPDPAPEPAPTPVPVPVPAPVAADDGPMPTFLSAPVGAPDDLMLVKGIGPKLNALLNSLGVFHFRQIAGWSADQVAEVDAKLANFKGRIARDEWQAQAKLLAAGDFATFEAKYGKMGENNPK